MSQAREEILARVRRARGDVPAGERPGDVAVTRGYRRAAAVGQAALLDRFEERLRDYGADVRRVRGDGVRGDEVPEQVAGVAGSLGLRRLAIPPRLPEAWRPAAVELVLDDGLSADELDRVDGALTGCAVAIAETGTVVLDGGPRSGRRALTLVPDHHLCVVEADQVVALAPEALAAVAPRSGERPHPVTLVSGPSATSDIELVRVQGVHGPRHLVVLIAE